jgi:glycosyltransferase involved in cell wall biosynthesis
MEYPPETGWGGIGTYTYNQAHALANDGNEVHVIALGVNSDIDYPDESVHVHRIKRIKTIKTKNPHFFGDCLIHSYNVFRKLKQLSSKLDVVEVPEWRAEGFVSVFLGKTLSVTRLHTPSYLVNQFSGKENDLRTHLVALNNALVNSLERKQTMYSTGITSPTKALQKEVAQAWNIDVSRITVIPNGIDINRIRSATIETLTESDYIVFVGRLEARKWVHLLAKALPGIFERFPNLKMVFVGSDMPYGKGTMKELILSINSKYIHNIDFTGFVTEERKFSLIRNSKLVVLPSLWENFPYTCLESMALGKAVIASKNSGFEEVIEDNSSGFLVEPGNCKALQSKIISCLEAEGQVSHVEKNARRKVENFNIVKVSKDSARYYERVLETSKQ